MRDKEPVLGVSVRNTARRLRKFGGPDIEVKDADCYSNQSGWGTAARRAHLDSEAGTRRYMRLAQRRGWEFAKAITV